MSTLLEKRTASLELALEQTASFGEAILGALGGVLERLQALEQALKQNAAFAESAPRLLHDISGRVAALEQALRDEAISDQSSEAVLRGFSERMDALRKSIPTVFDTPYAGPPKSADAPAALDLSTPTKLRDIAERLAVLEADLTRLAAAQRQNQNAVLTPSVFQALQETLKSVMERMGAIETSATRLSEVQKSVAFDPAHLEPLRHEIEKVSGRIDRIETATRPDPPALEPLRHDLEKVRGRLGTLEEKTDHLIAQQGTGFSPSFLETIQRIADRIGNLETKYTGPAETPAHPTDADAAHAQLLAQASRLYPKARTAVFVGTDDFADNIKYAFLAFCGFAEGKDMRATFLCATDRQYEQLRGAGLPCISPRPADWSPEDAKTLISAKVAVLGDYFHSRSRQGSVAHALLQGAKFVQLWHGIPFEEIGLQNLFATRGGNGFRAEDLAACGPFDVLAASTVTLRREWERWFSFREFAPVGLPRMDVFFKDLSPQDCVNVDEKALKVVQAARNENQRVVLYAPASREHNSAWLDEVGLDSLAASCREQGWRLYVHLHFEEQGRLKEVYRRYPSIDFVEPHTDIFPIAKYAHCLVTDYSSLTFDFIHGEKPVVFYRPDHGDYMLRAQPLVPNHEALTAGPVATQANAVIAAITDVFDGADRDKFRDLRTQLRRKLFDYHDGRSAARLCVVIQRHLEPGIHFVPVVS